MNIRMLSANKSVRLIKATFDAWMEDGALRLSAALAYYSIFSIAPLLVIAISVAGLVLGEQAVRGQLGPLLQTYIGPQAAEAVQSMIQSASKPSEGWIGATVGFLTLMLGASGVFGQLKDALNTIWEVKVESVGGMWGFLRGRLLNFGMVLIIGFLLLTSLLLSTALAGITGYVQHLAGFSAAIGVVLGFVVSFGVVTILFAFIFKVLPDVKIEWRSVWIGAAVTALLFEIGKFGLSYYLGKESTTSSFGAAGSVVILLLWVYYASCILLFGAEFTQVYAQESGHGIDPAPGAVPVTAEARAQQGLAPAKEPAPAVSAPLLIPIREKPAEPNPLGALLGVTALAFLVGIVARGRPKKIQKPAARLRQDFADLGDDAIDHLGTLWEHVSSEAKEAKRKWRK